MFLIACLDGFLRACGQQLWRVHERALPARAARTHACTHPKRHSEPAGCRTPSIAVVPSAVMVIPRAQHWPLADARVGACGRVVCCRAAAAAHELQKLPILWHTQLAPHRRMAQAQKQQHSASACVQASAACTCGGRHAMPLLRPHLVHRARGCVGNIPRKARKRRPSHPVCAAVALWRAWQQLAVEQRFILGTAQQRVQQQFACERYVQRA